MELRQYQVDVIQKCRESFKLGNKRIILCAPTGSGKTEVAIDIVKSAVAKGKRVLFVVNRKTLIDQAERRFRESGVICGIVQAENTRDEGRQVLICSIDTMTRRKHYPTADLIIIDEAHGATSPSYRRLLERWNNVPVVGLTATPYSRGLGKAYSWGTLFEDIVSSTTIKKLIDESWLVDVDIYAPSEYDLSKVKITAGDYDEKQLSEAIKNQPRIVGDIVENWRRIANMRPTVCFAHDIAHSKHIVASFLAVGVPSEHIDCYTEPKAKEAALKRVLDGETILISNVGMLCEGWDFPRLEAMILAKPTKSLIRYIQMAGRILRPHPEKLMAVLIDHTGAALSLGSPTEDQNLVLDDGKPNKSNKKDKKEKKLRKCPKCSYCGLSINPCPRCGNAYQRQNEIVHEEGELVEVTKGPKVTQATKQEFFSGLLYRQGQKGYSDGWTAHTYRDKFGVWPRGLDRIKKPPSEEVINFLTHKAIKYKKQQEKQQNGNI